MPIKIDGNLPARSSLESENIFVMTNERAVAQDIRPLKILILNLMPTKIETETQLLRLLRDRIDDAVKIFVFRVGVDVVGSKAVSVIVFCGECAAICTRSCVVMCHSHGVSSFRRGWYR